VINPGNFSSSSSIGLSFPFQVSIRKYRLDNVSKNVPFCSGSILSQSWILTAAHCLDNLKPMDRLLVVAGDINNDNNTNRSNRQTVRVKFMIPHGLHKNNSRNGYDIALLALSHPLDFSTASVQPINLSERNSKPTGKVILSGWGITEDFPKGSPILTYTNKIQILENEECQKMESRQSVKDSQICVIPDSPDVVADACRGDSGGPLTQLNQEGSFVLIGVVSYGNSCGLNMRQRRSPGVYTRVSYFIDWIYKNIVLFEILSGVLERE